MEAHNRVGTTWFGAPISISGLMPRDHAAASCLSHEYFLTYPTNFLKIRKTLPVYIVVTCVSICAEKKEGGRPLVSQRPR